MGHGNWIIICLVGKLSGHGSSSPPIKDNYILILNEAIWLNFAGNWGL
jgi:hypothetical protein